MIEVFLFLFLTTFLFIALHFTVQRYHNKLFGANFLLLQLSQVPNTIAFHLNHSSCLYHYSAFLMILFLFHHHHSICCHLQSILFAFPSYSPFYHDVACSSNVPPSVLHSLIASGIICNTSSSSPLSLPLNGIQIVDVYQIQIVILIDVGILYNRMGDGQVGMDGHNSGANPEQHF